MYVEAQPWPASCSLTWDRIVKRSHTGHTQGHPNPAQPLGEPWTSSSKHGLANTLLYSQLYVKGQVAFGKAMLAIYGQCTFILKAVGTVHPSHETEWRELPSCSLHLS